MKTRVIKRSRTRRQRGLKMNARTRSLWGLLLFGSVCTHGFGDSQSAADRSDQVSEQETWASSYAEELRLEIEADYLALAEEAERFHIELDGRQLNSEEEQAALSLWRESRLAEERNLHQKITLHRAARMSQAQPVRLDSSRVPMAGATAEEIEKLNSLSARGNAIQVERRNATTPEEKSRLMGEAAILNREFTDLVGKVRQRLIEPIRSQSIVVDPDMLAIAQAREETATIFRRVQQDGGTISSEDEKHVAKLQDKARHHQESFVQEIQLERTERKQLNDQHDTNDEK